MKRQTEKGITLLEITLAVAIVGVIAALSVRPMKGYLRRMDFKNSTQNIKHLVQTAQSKAMANPNVHIGVYFDTAATPNRIQLFQDLANPAAYNYDGSGDSAYMAPTLLKTGIRIKPIAGYENEIVFRGDGSAWKSMKALMTYVNNKDTLKDTLDVLASTGRVRVIR